MKSDRMLPSLPQQASPHRITIPVHAPTQPRNDWERAGLVLLGGALTCFLLGTLAARVGESQ
jgi:hypothetical protein